MEDIPDCLTIISELTDNSGENYENKFDEIKIKLNNELNKLNLDSLKDKCKELNLTGLSKLKKPEFIQLLENEFSKIYTTLREKNKNELKIYCKEVDIKKISTAKKEYILFQIMTHYATNLIFKIPDILPDIPDTQSAKNQQPVSLIEQLEKQKQEIENKMKEELRKQEEERIKIEEEKKRIEEEEKKRIEEEEKKRIEEEKLNAKKKKQAIPKNVRTIVWNHYIGEDIIKHKCLCCKKVTISNTNYEVGHVLSEKNGGTHEINNLRPICFACNHSMGAENMIDFVVKFGLYIG